MNLLKQAAVGGFCKYLDTIANGHEKQPKERHWYTGLGTSHDDFVMVLRQASITEDIESAIRYVDARVVDLGHRLYEEYILSRTGIEFQINQFASNLRKRAAKIEAEHIDKPSFESDDVFYHVDDPDSIFIVQEKVDDVIVAADERGRAHYFTDPWNLVKGE